MKKINTIVCNICGREFDEFDQFENYHIHKKLGYGTEFDGEVLDLHLCCVCMENVIKNCSITPIVNHEESI